MPPKSIWISAPQALTIRQKSVKLIIKDFSVNKNASSVGYHWNQFGSFKCLFYAHADQMPVSQVVARKFPTIYFIGLIDVQNG